MNEKIKNILIGCLMVGVVVFFVSIVFYVTVIGVGATHYGGTGITGIVDNVTLLPDQGSRFPVYLINFTDRQPRLMFLPPDYNITFGFKHWFQGEYQGDYYQAITVIGTFRGRIFNCMAVYDNPGTHKALYVRRGITTTYSDHYIFPEGES